VDYDTTNRTDESFLPSESFIFISFVSFTGRCLQPLVRVTLVKSVRSVLVSIDFLDSAIHHILSILSLFVFMPGSCLASILHSTHVMFMYCLLVFRAFI
jgi:hypothetical protein